MDRFEVAEYGLGGFDWQVEFDEDVAVEQEDDVDQMVSALRDQPEVSDAARADREIVLVAGPIFRDALEAWVRAWWS